jgi:hypothetical protein
MLLAVLLAGLFHGHARLSSKAAGHLRTQDSGWCFEWSRQED